jgi:excisionase family DNA binding protein
MTNNDIRETRSRPLYMKARGLAARWNLSLPQVYRMIESGEISVLRIGARSVRIPIEAIERYEAARRIPGEVA